jgi:hypothetical protein
MINGTPFSACGSLEWFVVPASVAAIGDGAFASSGIRSIGLEEGSVSFRVLDKLLVDFEVRSLVWVIGSPESILIPSSIEELRPFCCAFKSQLRIVEFEPNSNLRSIGQFAFSGCQSLESIWIPSSVEVLQEGCFQSCSNLETVTFGANSRLRVIEQGALGHCPSLVRVSIPASAEIVEFDDAAALWRAVEIIRGD